MCLIAVSINGKRASKENLKLGFDKNNQGLGCMFNSNGKLITKKDFDSFDEFYSYYIAIPLESNVVVHFRLATPGTPVNKECRHPFWISDTLAMAQNGAIRQWKKENCDQSDTMRFNENVLIPLCEKVPDFYKYDWAKFLIEDAIGDNNKIVFLDSGGYISIMNENKGAWEEDKSIWYSNLDWRPAVKPPKVENNTVNTNTTKPTTTINNKYNNLNCQTKYRRVYYSNGQTAYGAILSTDELKKLCAEHNLAPKKLKKKGLVIRVKDNQMTEKERLNEWLERARVNV